MSQVTLSPADAEEVIAVMARTGRVCEALEVELARRPPGRPRQWTVRGVLAALVLLARHEHAFFIDRIEALIVTLPADLRARLELNRPDGQPFTTRQFSYAWNEICRVIDPAQWGLSNGERRRRIDLCTWVNNELLWASTPREFRRIWSGDVAVDATLVWSHGRPPHTGKDKQHATGGDGLPTFLSNIDPCVFDDPNDTTHGPDHPFLDRLEANAPAEVVLRSDGRHRRRDRKRRPVGATWIGNKSKAKIVFGYAHHVAVACGADGDNTDIPTIAVGQITSPATANPALTGRLLLEELHRRRGGDGSQLGDVLADGGYSQAKPEHWTLPIRAMGAEPIFRLHGTNQEGHRAALRAGQLLLIDGRYYCSCLPDELRVATYPHRPTHDRAVNTKRKAKYRATIAARKPYEVKPIGRYRDVGLRFASPHTNGCPRCADRALRCCASKTFSLTWDQLGTYQRHQFGSEAWEASYNRRNRVEGYFGVLKNEAVGRHHRGCARFFEYAKVALTLTFNAIATNLHMIGLWRQRETAGVGRRTGRPRINPTLDQIADDPDRLDQARKRKRRRNKPQPSPKARAQAPPRPSNPFAHLGDPV